MNTTTTKIAGEAMQITDEQWYDLAQRHANADWNSDGYLAAIKAVCADYALLASKAAVPTGWKLVPVEPTDEMMLQESTCKHHAPFDMSCSARSNRMRIYRAMLAASPTAPAQSCGDAEQADEAVTLPIMRAAFRVVETEGDPDPDKQRFHLRFTFRSMRELDAACDEWRAFSNAARAKDSK